MQSFEFVCDFVFKDFVFLNQSSQTLRAFSKTFDRLDNGNFERMYDKYCDFKHVNIMSNGVTAETMNEEVVDWAIEIMAGIVLYLQRYGLEPMND